MTADSKSASKCCMGLPLFGVALPNLALALMVGGMLVLGAFVAPVVFKAFPRAEAGAAMMVVFLRFDIVLLVSLRALIFGEVVRFKAGCWQNHHWLNKARWILLALLTSVLIYSTQVINPDIARMHDQGIHPNSTPQGIAFAKEHKLSETLYKTQLMLALLLLLATPFVPLSNCESAEKNCSSDKTVSS